MMARQVFFSFHYKEDAWRVAQIRNSWLIGAENKSNPLYDKAEWESIERGGERAIRNWIDSQLKGASVTVVLIGAKTVNRPWVRYEIQKSHRDGKGIIGVYLVGMKNQNQDVGLRGADPIAAAGLTDADGRRVTYPTYDWLAHDGRANLGKWVEQAARAVGR